MAERKVLNKYIPPDFDPSKIPRLRLGKSRQIKVRLVAPFSMRCETCGQWIGKGTKFNARKEAVEGEKFHSIQILRFYIRCQQCAAEITYKTDPENLNYLVEKGAQRNFEPWREEKALNEQLQQDREDEEENNPIKALENRTEQSRREMEAIDALDEVRMLNARGERVAAVDGLLEEKHQEREAAIRRLQDEEDEQIIRQAYSTTATAAGGSGRRIKRAREEDALERERQIRQAVSAEHGSSTAAQPSGSVGALARAALGIKTVKKKPEQPAEAEPTSEATLAGMLGAYGSDSEDSE